MNVFFFFVVAIIAIVFLLVVVGANIHMIYFRKIFGAVTQRMTEQIEIQKANSKEQAPGTCAFCRGTIPGNAAQCPNCGAKRE
jgi:hypothetical protein